MNSKHLITALLMCSGTGWAAPAGNSGFEAVDFTLVHVAGEMGRRIDMTVRKNFLALDLDRDFLKPFRARRPRQELKGADRFCGLGLAIDAAVLFAKATNDPEVIRRKNYLVEETIRTQSPGGYIGLALEESANAQLWWEFAFHEAVYITYGLSQDYRYFGNTRALEAARKLALNLMSNWPNRPGPYFTTLGSSEAFFSLSALTRDPKYLRFAVDEPMGKQYRIFPAPLKSWEQALLPARPLTPEEKANTHVYVSPWTDSCHMYRIFERSMMQVRLNAIEPRENLLVMSRRLVDGMTRPERTGMLITGATGRNEGWHEDQGGQGPIGENCANIYSLWFFDELARHDGDLSYGDFMERILFNEVYASQDPEGRRVRYFTPFSGKRQYYGRDSMCCPNNFRRGMARLPELLYYRTAKGIAINLYAASHAVIDLRGGPRVELEQRTDYPASGRVEIAVSPSKPVRFPLLVRVPRWCASARISVNSGEARTAKPGSFEIAREWRAGDRVLLEMPMPWRFIKGRELQAGRAALVRGPVVYCLNPERNVGLKIAELRDLILEPGTVQGPARNGTSARMSMAKIRASSPGRNGGESPLLILSLSEFPDPGGEEIYFRLSDPSAGDDELLRRQ